LLGGSVILWSLALAGFVVATGVISMAVARLVFGTSQAACYPVLTKVSKNWFPLSIRPTAQGLIGTLCGRAGGAAAFLVFGMLMLGVLDMPWRSAVLVLAALGVATGVIFVLVFRNTLAEHPWANQAEADFVIAGDPESRYASHSRLNWRATLSSPNVWLLCGRSVASNMADGFFVYWAPYYLRTIKQVELVDAGWMSALPLLGGALGGLFSGLLQTRLLRRTRDRRWSRTGVGATGKFVAAALMLSVLGMEEPGLLAFTFLAVKFFTDWEQPAEWGATTDLGGRNAATVFAVVNTAGSAGGVVGLVLMGHILNAHSIDDVPTASGWRIVFILVAGEYLVAAVCWLFIDCRRTLLPLEDTR
jgi:ACS family glucarate transporter-like MFS transporter